jgi:hypothetical protein
MYIHSSSSRFSVSNFVYGPERNPKAHDSELFHIKIYGEREREREFRERGSTFVN